MTDTPIYIDDNILYPPFTIDKCDVFVNRANENGKNVIQYGENRYAIAYNEIMGKKEVKIDVPDYDSETGEQTGTHKETIIIDYPVINPNYEREKQEQEKERRNIEIDNKIKELREMSLTDIMNNNKENIQIYNDVISGLELSRP